MSVGCSKRGVFLFRAGYFEVYKKDGSFWTLLLVGPQRPLPSKRAPPLRTHGGLQYYHHKHFILVISISSFDAEVLKNFLDRNMLWKILVCHVFFSTFLKGLCYVLFPLKCYVSYISILKN